MDPDPAMVKRVTAVWAKLDRRLAKIKTLSLKATTYVGGKLDEVHSYRFKRPGLERLDNLTVPGSLYAKNQTPPLAPAGFEGLVHSGAFPGENMIHTTLDGEPVTVVQSVDIGSSFDIRRVYISDRTGLPLGMQELYGDHPLRWTRYTDLEIDRPIDASVFRTSKPTSSSERRLGL